MQALEGLRVIDMATVLAGPGAARYLARDPHVRERDVLTDVGGVVMPGPVARLSRTPGRITGPGRPLGADTDEVLSETARPEEVE